MATIQRIAKNSGVIIFNYIAETSINLIIAISLAKYFGQSGFGKLSFLGTFFFFLGSADSLWIKPVLVREVVRDKGNAGRLIGNGLIIRSLLSVAIIILFWITVWVVNCPADIVKLAIFTSIGLLLSSIVSSYGTIFQVNLKMEYFVGSNLLSRVLTLIIVYMVIFSKANLFHYYVLALIPSIILVFLVKHYSGRFIKLNFDIDFELWRKIFRESWPLGLTSIFIFTYHRIDQVMLFHMKGADSVGSYSVAVKLAESFNIIPIALMVPLLPLMSKYFTTSKENFEKIYQLSFKYLLLFIVPVAVSMTIFSSSIISFLYGKQFLSSSPVLSILIWAEVFVFMGVVNNTILIATNRQIIDPLFTGTSALVNIALNLILIPRYGFVGAAIATLIAYPTGPVMGYFLKPTKAYSRCMFQSLIKPLFASLAMSCFIYGFRLNLWVAIIISPLIYIVVMCIIQGIDQNDLQRMKSIIFYRNV